MKTKERKQPSEKKVEKKNLLKKNERKITY